MDILRMVQARRAMVNIILKLLIKLFKSYILFFSEIPANCANAANTEDPMSSGKSQCTACKTGAYADGQACPLCNADPARTDCSECVKVGPDVICTACTTPTNSGFNCQITTACTDPTCASTWTTATSTCKCKTCPANQAVTAQVAGLFGTCGPAQTPAAIPDCDIEVTVTTPTAADLCARCNSGFLPKADGTCHAVSGLPNCQPGYKFLSPADAVLCNVPDATYFPHGTVGSNPVQTTSSRQATTPCTGYLSINGDTGDDGRCAGCPPGQIIEATSATQYNCRTCAVGSKTHCSMVVANAGNCLCGRCTTDTPTNKYIMKPDQSECTQCTGITDCNAYTLRLNNGAYECACTLCGSSKILSADGKTCVDCSSLTCTGGTITVSSGTTCTCECGTGQIKKSDNTGCVSCAAAQKPNCASGNFALDSSSACICTKCDAGYVLKSDKSCLSCTASNPGGDTPNCKTCTESGSTPGNIDVCQKCDDNFALNPGTSPTIPTCMACQTGCKTCTVDTSAPSATTVKKCTVCNAGYVLNNEGTCIQCPTSPAACSECRINPSDNTQALCLQFGCSGTASLRDSDFKCESCTVSNCKKCVKDIAGTVKCLKCNDAHYMDSSGNCQACVANCAFCVDGTTCIPNGCKEGFIRHRVDGNCITCTGTGVARCIYESAESDNLIPKICKSGYKLNTGVTPNVCERKLTF